MDKKLKKMMLGFVLYAVPAGLFIYTLLTGQFQYGVNWPLTAIGAVCVVVGVYIFVKAVLEQEAELDKIAEGK